MTVYFIQADGSGSIKIGYTKHLNSRVKGLQTSSPVPLKLITSMKGGRSIERALHARFSDLRIRGEWFRPDPELLKYIEEITRDPAEQSLPEMPDEVWCFVENWKDPVTGYAWEIWIDEKQRAGRFRGAAWMGREYTEQETDRVSRYAEKYLWLFDAKKGWVRPKVKLPKESTV